ncbi:hypothetical protein MMC13_007929 [Lambiella insularis]|nr:hypothetical protein [Lambiella insularis]
MATSSGANVLRYSALGGGLFYGFYHQRTLTSHAERSKISRRYQEEVSLIAKAKAEFTKKTVPKESRTEGGGVTSGPNDPNLDLEAYLTMKMADEAK